VLLCKVKRQFICGRSARQDADRIRQCFKGTSMCFYEAFSFALRMDVVPGRVTVNNNLLVVYRESVNPIGYITRGLSADSLQL